MRSVLGFSLAEYIKHLADWSIKGFSYIHVRHISIFTRIPLNIHRKAATGSRDLKLYLKARQITQDISLALILTSPIMTASSGAQPVSLSASRKNVFSGFPTTMAFVSVAYSKAVTNGPGPRAKPSFLL